MIPFPSTRIVVICGPTGSGKTKFAIDLALNLRAEIVGADSMQIFRHMDIGTAKPTASEQAAAPHHLVDIVAPDSHFDAARYVQMADNSIYKIIRRQKIPLIVGGTGLYIKSLIHGLFQAPPSDPVVRKELKETIETHGKQHLYRYLTQVDPISAEKINCNDTQRLLRAIEYFKMTGKPISGAQKQHGFETPRYLTLKIGLHRERDRLYQRINQRVDCMISDGLLEEVKRLLKMGYSPELKSMQSLGYRHMIHFIQGKLSWQEAIRTLKRDHRRYAKRQLTWFGADQEIHWISPSKKEHALTLAMDFLNPPHCP